MNKSILILFGSILMLFSCVTQVTYYQKFYQSTNGYWNESTNYSFTYTVKKDAATEQYLNKIRIVVQKGKEIKIKSVKTIFEKNEVNYQFDTLSKTYNSTIKNITPKELELEIIFEDMDTNEIKTEIWLLKRKKQFYLGTNSVC